MNFETDGEDKTDFNVGEFDKFDRFSPTEKSKIKIENLFREYKGDW